MNQIIFKALAPTTFLVLVVTMAFAQVPFGLGSNFPPKEVWGKFFRFLIFRAVSPLAQLSPAPPRRHTSTTPATSRPLLRIRPDSITSRTTLAVNGILRERPATNVILQSNTLTTSPLGVESGTLTASGASPTGVRNSAEWLRPR
jgi:hypothetical protein